MRAVCVILSLLAMLVAPLMSSAAPPLIPPGQAKLPAPANVLCPVVDTDVVVTWDLVGEAAAYQVEWSGMLPDGTLVGESDFVGAPPDSIPLDSTLLSMTVHVRAVPAPKHAGGPVQGGGPKGLWSDVCVVAIPAAL